MNRAKSAYPAALALLLAAGAAWADGGVLDRSGDLRSLVTAPSGTSPSESETDPPAAGEAEPGAREDPESGTDVIRPPQAEEPDGFGGCIFDRTPLELLV